MEDLKPGDTVALKHSSQTIIRMTIESISNDIAKCVYFMNSDLKQVEINII